jgi:hypothetical protein
LLQLLAQLGSLGVCLSVGLLILIALIFQVVALLQCDIELVLEMHDLNNKLMI